LRTQRWTAPTMDASDSIRQTEAASSYPSFLAQGDFVYRAGGDAPIAGAEGNVLVDVNGRRLLDAEAANGTAAFGYDAELIKEACDAVACLPALPSFVESRLRLDAGAALSAWFSRATGRAGRVAFELGGAQGIELALKIARSNAPGRAVAVFEGAYHGRSIYTAHLSASSRYRQHGLATVAEVIRLPYPDDHHNRLGHEPATSAQASIDYVERTLEDDLCGAPRDFCALLLEPVLNVGGMIYPSPIYLNRVVELFRRRGALIIVDEIFSGFYRTGRPLGLNHYDFAPDIVVTSKGLSNGIVPLSCVWAREPLLTADRFPPGSHSVTYANNPLNMAVALATLRRYEAWSNIEADMAALESRLAAAMTGLARRHPLVSSTQARGATARLVLSRPVAAAVRDAARHAGRDGTIDGYSGLLVASTGLAPHVVAFHPPLVFSASEVDSMRKILDIALTRIESESAIATC